MTPDYQYYMKPVLEFLANKEKATTREILDGVVASSVPPEILDDLLPSGRSRAVDRIHWAKTYLHKSGLLESPERAVFKITKRGREALKSGKVINGAYLSQFPEYREFKSRTSRESPGEQAQNDKDDQSKTPEELMSEGHAVLTGTLVDDLKQQLHGVSARYFEQIVLDVLVAMGYGGSIAEAGKALGQSGDGGVDGIIKEDKLGLDVIYLQAKRWENPVGRPVVQAFAGSLAGFRATKGVIITTSKFTKEAVDYTQRIASRIILIDGDELARLMIEYGVGVSLVRSYDIKRLDEDYFDEQAV